MGHVTLSFPVKMADGVYKAFAVREQQQGRVHAPRTIMALRLAFMLALAVALRVTETAVSYTHLTLPTNHRV